MRPSAAKVSFVFASACAAALVFFWSVPARAAVCPVEDPARGIRCLGSNTICGNTCRLEPTCPTAPDTQKAKLDCGGCTCQCPDTRPVDCLGANGMCQAHIGTCAGQHRDEVCSTAAGETTMRCGNCVTGYQDCDGTCKANTADFCKFPSTWNTCAQTCDWAFILTNYPTVPAGATVPQNSRIQASGDSKLLNGDLYLSSNQSIRVDQIGGKTKLNIGNLVTGNDGIAVRILGNTVTDGLTVLQYPLGEEPALAPPNAILTDMLCLTDGTACRRDWPVGLPIGAGVQLGDTLRYGAAAWVADSALYNSGSRIGFFTNDPWYRLDLESDIDNAMLDFYDKSAGSDLWTGLRLTRGADKWNDEKWFVGLPGDPVTSDDLVIANNKAESPYALVVKNDTGHVGIGTASPGNDRLSVYNGNGVGGAIRATSTGNTVAVSGIGHDGAGVVGTSFNRAGVVGTTQGGTAVRAEASTGKGITSTTLAGGSALGLYQSGTLNAAANSPVLAAYRAHALNGFDNVAPMMMLVEESGASGDYFLVQQAFPAADVLRLARDGNLGLGNVDPAKNLDISGASGGVILRLRDDSGGVPALWTGLNLSRANDEKWFVGLESASDKLLFRRDGDGTPSNDMVIDTAGKVGIGRESPAEKLDINGKVKMTGFQLTTGAQNDYILTSDAAGNGVWGVKPTGLPTGGGVNPGDTLRYDGANWIANSFLHNNGTRIGIGQTAPDYKLDLKSSATDDALIARLNDFGGLTPKLYTGSVLSRSNSEKWFLGMNDANEDFRLTRNGDSVNPPAFTVDNETGNVGVNVNNPTTKFEVSSADTANASNTFVGSLFTATHVGTISGGSDSFIGLKSVANNSAAHMGGIASARGGWFEATGTTSGDTNAAYGVRGEAQGGDLNYGVEAVSHAGTTDGTAAAIIALQTGALNAASTSGSAAAIDATNDATYGGTGNPLKYGINAAQTGRWDGTSYGLSVSNGNTIDAANGRSKYGISVQNVGQMGGQGSYGLQVLNSDTDTIKDGARKYGAYLRSNGDFFGMAGADTVNYGLYVDDVSGADWNFAAIFKTGNVGIGDTAPAKNLDIKSTTGGVIARLNDAAGAGGELWTGLSLARSGNEKWFVGIKGAGAPNAPGDKLFLRAAESDDNEVVFDTNGSVGIGLADDVPDEKLDVNGTIQMTGLKLPTGASDKYVLTTDAAGVGTWQNMQFADECFGGKFNKFSDIASDGGLGGYSGANALCGDPALHICTPDELMRTLHCDAGSLPLFGMTWVANGPPGFTSPAANDCIGFTSNAGGPGSAAYGAFWEFAGATGGKGFVTTCDSVMRVACCSL